jgi:(2Fe-2S) ferredoxin
MLLRAPCLRVCGQAPVLVLYPRGDWYGRMTQAGVQELLQGGSPDHCLIYRMGAASEKSPSNPLPKTPSDLH